MNGNLKSMAPDWERDVNKSFGVVEYSGHFFKMLIKKAECLLQL